MNRLGVVVGRVCAAVVIGAVSTCASAGEIEYEAAAFDAALARRGGFVVAVVADWCNACSLQKSRVAELLAEPRYEDLDLFIADFDRDRALRQRLKVVRQGTFVVFKDGAEVARSIGTTDKAALAALFDQAR